MSYRIVVSSQTIISFYLIKLQYSILNLFIISPHHMKYDVCFIPLSVTSYHTTYYLSCCNSIFFPLLMSTHPTPPPIPSTHLSVHLHSATFNNPIAQPVVHSLLPSEISRPSDILFYFLHTFPCPSRQKFDVVLSICVQLLGLWKSDSNCIKLKNCYGHNSGNRGQKMGTSVWIRNKKIDFLKQDSKGKEGLKWAKMGKNGQNKPK